MLMFGKREIIREIHRGCSEMSERHIENHTAPKSGYELEKINCPVLFTNGEIAEA
jgi:hypothetical protein